MANPLQASQSFKALITCVVYTNNNYCHCQQHANLFIAIFYCILFCFSFLILYFPYFIFVVHLLLVFQYSGLWLFLECNNYCIYSKGAKMVATFFTKFLANIFDFAVIFRPVYSENKTTYELIYTMSIIFMHNQ